MEKVKTFNKQPSTIEQHFSNDDFLLDKKKNSPW